MSETGNEFIDRLLAGMGPERDLVDNTGRLSRPAPAPAVPAKADDSRTGKGDLEQLLAGNVERLRKEGRDENYIKSYVRGWRGVRR